MIFLKLFLFLILKGTLADELETNKTESNGTERSGVQMWRAEGDFDKDVLEEFEERAHFTEDIWKRDNRTIDFLLFNEETEDLAAFLDAYNVSHKVLMDDVRENVDDAILEKFPPKHRPSTNVEEPIGDSDTSDVPATYSETSVLAETELKGVQLWRAQGDFDDDVLNKFYDRASKGEEIWIRDNRTIDFLLFNVEQEKIIGFMKEHGLTYSVLISDVREKVDEALLQTFPTRRNAVSGDSFTWKNYPSLNEINDYLHKMAATYPTHCKIITLGKTLHSKPIYMLKISNGDRNNKAILVDSGMHGREWTSVISTLYFIDSIVRKFYQQPEYITKKNWHIIPVLNPDGYDYSLTTDRLWRKNRRRMHGTCYGVDVNRNFGYNWGKHGGAHDACSENYGGPVPFSEEESKAFKRLTDGTHFYGYLSVHSAGTKVLYPLGADHDDHHQHLLITKEIALAMRKVDNQQFLNRDVIKMGTNSFGMAMDWMYFIKHIKHSYIIETRGHHGLDIISSQKILPAAKEVNAGLMRFAEILK